VKIEVCIRTDGFTGDRGIHVHDHLQLKVELLLSFPNGQMISPCRWAQQRKYVLLNSPPNRGPATAEDAQVSYSKKVKFPSSRARVYGTQR